MSPARVPWFRDPSRHGCLVSWSRNQGEGRGMLVGTCVIRVPGSPERGWSTLVEVLDAQTGRVLTLDTWRVSPVEGGCGKL